MLCAIKKSTQKQVKSFESKKDEKPFNCPSCQNEVILKKGMLRVDHFAHKVKTSCLYGFGESEKHRLCKMGIYESLKNHPRVRLIELEFSLNGCRPDVYLELKSGHRLAIEVQISDLTMEEIIRRTKNYERLGIYVLWLPPYNKKLFDGRDGRYSPKSWEKWLHAFNFGRIFYWIARDEVMEVKFGDYMLFRGGYTSYDLSVSVPDQWYPSRRYRTVSNESPLLTLRILDFVPCKRQAWNSKFITIPLALVWTKKRYQTERSSFRSH